MGTGLTRRWIGLWLAVAGIAAAAAFLALRPASAASASECASLGQAANFVAFSNGDFNASPPGGENITGRIAAARDVTLGGPGSGGVYVSGATGRLPDRGGRGATSAAAPSTARAGSLNGGVRYGGTSSVASNFYINGGTQHGDPPFSFVDEFSRCGRSAHPSPTWSRRAGPAWTLTHGALESDGNRSRTQRVHRERGRS